MMFWGWKRASLSPRNSAILPRVTTKITYWKEPDGRYLGYLNAYPDHWTQGDDLDDLKDHLRDLHQTFCVEEIQASERKKNWKLREAP